MQITDWLGIISLLTTASTIILYYYFQKEEMKTDRQRMMAQKYCDLYNDQLKITKDLKDQRTEIGKELTKVKKELDLYKKNPDGSMKVLNDLMNNKECVLRVSRVDPNSIFLRSPKEFL